MTDEYKTTFEKKTKSVYETKIGAHLHCLRCGNEWHQRFEDPPKVCPKCGSKAWNHPTARSPTVQKIPKVIEKSNPEDYYLGVRVKHVNGAWTGKFGTILAPKKPTTTTKTVDLVVDNRGVNHRILIDNLKIVQEVSK